MKEEKISVSAAKAGMTLSRSAYDESGRLLVPADFILTPKAIGLLKMSEVREVYVKEVFDRELAESQLEDHRVERIRQTAEFKAFDKAYNESVNSVKGVMDSIMSSSHEVDTESLLANVENILTTNQTSTQIFDMLHCIRNYDDSTYVHCVNVSLICNVMGKWLKLPPKDIETLTLAGLLHDTGKLMMPREIITKPGRLTQTEYEIIKKHPGVGYQILKHKNLDEHIKLAVLQHHEKCDGSGYPSGLTREQIDPFAKIVAIADVYDAMTADRVYRAGVCPFDVIELFEEEGLEKYDTYVLLNFLEHIVSSYINKQVLLSNNKEAKIIMVNKQRLAKPVVCCGTEYIDLAKTKDLTIKAVL